MVHVEYLSKPSVRKGPIRALLGWSFHAPEADRRWARSALVIASLLSVGGMILFVCLSLVSGG